VTSVRGESVSKVPAPAGRIAISSHCRSPANWATPKFSGTENRPPVTGTLVAVTVVPIWTPSVAALNNRNCMSKGAVAGPEDRRSSPW
jgi:hypothetical protein